MSALIPECMTDDERAAVHARMSALFDRAAQNTGVSPAEFRAAIREAMQYAEPAIDPRDVMPEAFVLSLIGQLF